MQTVNSLVEAQAIQAIAHVAQADGTWIVYEPGDTLPDGLFGPPPDPEAERRSAIRAERDRRILAGGYKVGAHWFHSDLVSRGQQTGLVIMGANVPPGLTWRTMGGPQVPMTPTLAQQIFQAAALSDATLHAVTDAAISAGVEPAAVNWPPAFGDPDA